MRPLLLSLVLVLPLLHAARAQDTEQGGNVPQLPVGQVFKKFEFPEYEAGKLKATFYATEARGVTLNRAETIDLRITIYNTNSKGDTTTITSPNADLYVAEQKLRTKNTVEISNSDTTATAQECDFNLKTKKYLLRTNVKVVLKNFDLSPPAPAAGGVAKPPATETK